MADERAGRCAWRAREGRGRCSRTPVGRHKKLPAIPQVPAPNGKAENPGQGAGCWTKLRHSGCSRPLGSRSVCRNRCPSAP
eukprot:519384-Pyramimonas_sp.AAC.1